MSVYSGPEIPDNGLVFCIDGNNHKSFLRKKQSSNLLVDPNTWTAGTGGFTGYSANGPATEQLRAVIADDPWGGTSVIWRTTPSGDSDADGGWNTASYTIDRDFTYRFSVWVRRHTSGTGGSFYLGMNPAPIRNDTGTSQSNPYFSYPSQASLVQNQWYLVVGHCFYESYTGGRHPDSGWYTLGSKISDLSFGNIGNQDVRWAAGTASALHRTYHYYAANAASGLEFAFPRMDKCDGTEPTIQELINIGESRPRSLVSSIQTATSTAGILYTNNALQFNGTTDYIDTGNTFTFAQSGQFSVEVWLKVLDHSDRPSAAAGIFGKGHYYDNQWDIWLSNNNSIYFETTGNPTRQGLVYLASPVLALNTWYHYVATYNNGTKSAYLNGVLVGTQTYTGPGDFSNTNNVLIGRRFGDASRSLRGDVSTVKIYNRALSASEVQQNFQALKSRYGIE